MVMPDYKFQLWVWNPLRENPALEDELYMLHK